MHLRLSRLDAMMADLTLATMLTALQDLDAEDEPPIPLERVTDPAETQRLLELVEREAEAKSRAQTLAERHLRDQLGYGMEREAGMDGY